MNSGRIRMLHIRDQAWADITRHQAAIERLAEGTFSVDDLAAVGPMARVLAGELRFRGLAAAGEKGLDL